MRSSWRPVRPRLFRASRALTRREIPGDQQGTPKVACPLHKKTFSLDSGLCLGGEDYQVRVFPVRVEMDALFVALPPEEGLDAPIWVEDNTCATHCAVPCG